MYFFGNTYFHTLLTKNVFNVVFLLILITELTTTCISLYNSLRNPKASKRHDQGSMLCIMMGFCVSILSSPVIILADSYVLPDIIFWVGILLALFGMSLRIISILTLKQFFTLSVQVQNKQNLVQTGPYRILRHPAYTGSILTLLGIALSFRSPLGIAATAIVSAVVYSYRIKVEEREMENRFGLTYLLYMKSTWRLLPFIW
jgi:protein-S-isoprenylcysteine O-methyltransferase Ste14